VTCSTATASGVAIALYGMVGLLLGGFGLWKCGLAPFLRGLAFGALTSSIALAALLVLQTTVLYRTF
jgi:hypothetical protein